MIFKPQKPTPQFLMPWHPGVTVSVQRASDLLQQHSHTTRRMIEDGTLEGFRMRRHNPNSPYRVILESVHRVLDERKIAGVDPMSVDDAATMLGCSATLIRSLIRDGELRASRRRLNLTNSDFLVNREDVIRLTHKWREDAGVPVERNEAVRQSA